MVAVNPRFTLLALSLASLSLAPSADAAAINARSSSSDPGSPSKAARQQQQLPMPMKRMVTGKNVRADDVFRRSKDLKSRVVEANTPLREAFLKRQQQQAHFPRKHVETREDAAGTPGHVDIVSSTTNSTEGHLLYNATTSTLDASPDKNTTLVLVPSSDSNHYTLQMSMVNTTTNATEAYCGTYDPAPMTPQPVRMEHCVNGSTPHSSQVFSYDPSTGVIAPIWSNGGDRNGTSASNNPSSTRTLDSRDTPQNVTLVFVPNSKNDVAAQEVDSDPDSASATTTVTTTVTATATPSFAVADFDAGSSSMTASSSQSTSDLFLSSTSSSQSSSFAAADFDPASSTMDAVSSQPTSSSSPTGSSVAPASSSDASRVGALAVEVAPAPSSSTDSIGAVPSSASSVPSASASDSSASASSAAVDAAAVASDIVASNAFSSGSASATASASSSASAANAAPSVAPATNDEQAVYVGNAARGAGTAQWRRE